jgi:hypothetical protein
MERSRKTVSPKQATLREPDGYDSSGSWGVESAMEVKTAMHLIQHIYKYFSMQIGHKLKKSLNSNTLTWMWQLKKPLIPNMLTWMWQLVHS